MAYLVSDLKNDLESALHGTTINKVQNVDGLIYRAARQLLLDLDPQETKRITELTNALYDDVFRYSSPSDLKGNAIIDIRPQVSRTSADNISQTFQKSFDLGKSVNRFPLVSTEWDDGTKYLLVDKVLEAGILVNGCDSLTANGTWSASSSASTLAVDQQYYESGGASLKYNINTSTATAILENSTMTRVDLGDHDELSSIFVWVYIPDTSVVTNYILRWGNDSSNYWSRTVTANFDSTAFRTGWNLLRFDWNGATETGTVDPEAIDYIRLTLTHTQASAVSGFRLDSIYSRLPSIYEIVYYSKFLFRTSGGTWQETITADTNIINLDTDSYNLLVDKCIELAAQQLQGSDSVFDTKFFKDSYERGVKMYQSRYKSEVMQPQQNYYNVSNPPR